MVQATCIGGVINQPTVTFATTPGIYYQSPTTPEAGGDYLLFASPEPGYAWGPMPAGWTILNVGNLAIHNVELTDSPPCSDTVPTAPTVNQASCGDGTFTPPSVVIPASTTVISYAQVGQAAVGRSVIVTAELERDTDTWATSLPAGWAIQGSFAVFPAGPFAKAVCTPADPVVTAATCKDGVVIPASVDVPAETDAMIYGITTDQVGTLVTVNTKAGSVLIDPLPTGWVSGGDSFAIYEGIDPDTNPYTATNLAAPQVFHAMVVDAYEPGDVIDLVPLVPASRGVTYQLTGIVTPSGTLTVTAALRDGYAWPDVMPPGWIEIDDDTATHTFTLDGDLDIVANPVAPSVDQASCGGGDPLVTLPGTTGVTYAKTGDQVAGGTVTVTAKLDAGHGWSGNLPTGWIMGDDATARYVVQLAGVTCEPDEDVMEIDEPASPGAAPNSIMVTGLPSTGAGTPGMPAALWMLLVAVTLSMALAISTRHRGGQDARTPDATYIRAMLQSGKANPRAGAGGSEYGQRG